MSEQAFLDAVRRATVGERAFVEAILAQTAHRVSCEQCAGDTPRRWMTDPDALALCPEGERLLDATLRAVHTTEGREN
jgi:hypothetical protein